jgi:hypothetical protein
MRVDGSGALAASAGPSSVPGPGWQEPSAREFVPDGYGATGFQASGVDFPTEGCRGITGALPSSSLRFVTFVIKKGA